ncbi:MAG: TM2 domain-containing protein, partial [Actinomyces sp.]|nr:TM2 domain-containing protein [Actinomyces sp.]
PQYGQAAPGVAPKSMAVAIVLGILLGTFGVHNFYLGYVQKGVVQLALTLLGAATSWLLIGGVVVVAVFVWVVVDIVQIATRQGRYVVDANGLPLQ